MADFDTTPYWQTSVTLPHFRSLDRDLHVDVAIVGGGITGITAAYLLKKAGKSVALLERHRCLQADTGHTTAHLTCVTDTRLSALARSFGADHARATWDAGLAAIAQIDGIVRTEAIECGFAWVPGYLHAPHAGASTSASRGDGEQEAETLRDGSQSDRRNGLRRALSRSRPVHERPRHRDRRTGAIQSAAISGGAARAHPRRQRPRLRRDQCRRHHDDRETTTTHDANHANDAPLSVTAGYHTITCDYVIVATHNPIVGRAGAVSVVAAADEAGAVYVLRRQRTRGVRIDSRRAVLGYFRSVQLSAHRTQSDGASRGSDDVVIYGGADHKTGQADDTRACFEQIEADLKRLVPDVDDHASLVRQVIETNDGLPFIGEMAPKQFAATGFSGNGMTFGTLAAMMASDAALGRSNPWRELFDIGRTKIRGGLWDYLTENKDYPYYMIRDRFAGAEGTLAAGAAARRGQAARHRRRARRRLSRRRWRGDDAVAGVHAHGMRRAVEHGGADVGLSVSRLALLAEGRGARPDRRNRRSRKSRFPRVRNARARVTHGG